MTATARSGNGSMDAGKTTPQKSGNRIDAGSIAAGGCKDNKDLSVFRESRSAEQDGRVKRSGAFEQKRHIIVEIVLWIKTYG